MHIRGSTHKSPRVAPRGTEEYQMRHCLFALLTVALLSTANTAAFAQKKKGGKKLKAIQPAKVSLGRPVDFTKDVAPILEAKCVACHNVAIDESKLNLEDVKSILKGGKRGPAVVAKQPDKSLMYQLAARGKGPAMPPMPNKVDATILTAKELGILRQWILEGANAGMSSKGAAVAWAPLPPTLQPIYSVALTQWGRYAAAGRANQISIYDTAAGKQVAQLTDPALSPIQYEGRTMYPGGAAHRDFVHSLAFSPDGNLLASGGFRTVKLWKKQSGSKVYQVTAGNAVKSIAVSPDRNLLAIGSADNSIQIVEAKTGKTQKKLTGHKAAISTVQFSADGSKLVSAAADKSIRVWDIAKASTIRTITSTAVSNQAIFNKDATQIITADADNTLRIWAVAKPKPKKDAKKPAGDKPVRELKGHAKPVTSLALILPQGTMVVSGSEDGSARTWTLSNGRASRTMSLGAPITAVAVRPDGQQLAVVGTNGTGRIFQTSNGKQLAELKGDPTVVEKLAGLIEEQTVAKQRATTRASELKTAEKNLKDRTAAVKKAMDAKKKADTAFTAAEKKYKPLLAAVDKAKAALAKKPKDNKLKQALQKAERAASKPKNEYEKAKNTRDAADRSVKLAEKSVKRATDQVTLAKKNKTAADDVQKKADAAVKTAQAGDNKGGKPLRSIAYSADGKTLLTGSDDGKLQLWSGTDGQPLEALAAHKAAVSAVAFGQDGVLISGSADKTAVAWNTAPTWKLIARLGTPKDKPLDLTMSPFVARILSLSFSRDGKLLATGGGDPSRSGELFIWDVAKQTMVREIKDAHSDTILGLQFNWDGTQILSGSSDKFAKIHDVATGRKIRSFEGHTHHVLDVAWQADGSAIVTGGADNVIKIWNAKTGEQRRTVGGYNKQVTSVQFIGTNDNIVACSGDAKVNMHRIRNGQRFRGFSGASDYVYASAAARSAAAVVKSASTGASVVVAGGEDGVLRIWNGTAQTIKNFDPPKPPRDKKQASAK